MYLMLGARVDVKNETGKAGIRMIVLKGKKVLLKEIIQTSDDIIFCVPFGPKASYDGNFLQNWNSFFFRPFFLK